MEHILAKDLRDAVLQAALEGKLTTREQNDSCINETLLEIKNDINIKLKNKEIKKLPLFEDSCEDYDSLPDKWIGVRLGQISYFISKGTTPRGGNVAYVDNGIGFLRAENVAGYDKLSFENLKYVTAEMNEGFLQRSKLQENDILITIAGTLGRTGLVRKSDLPLNANQAVSIVRTYPEKLNLRYLIMAINAPSVQKSFLDLTRTTAIPNLTLEIISNIYIPLPPIEEQQRIVDKVDELMTKIDEYEKIENQLVQLKEEFPGDMRDAILQGAFSGKLTKQQKDDSDAFVLAEKIKEKRTLKGKSKYITDSEFDIDVPENWAIIKSGECFSLDKAEKVTNVKLPYLEAKYLRGKTTPTIMSEGEFVKKGTKVILVDGENSGEIFIEPEDGIIGSTFKVLYMPEEINEKYALYFLEKNRTIFRNNKKGAAIPHLSKELFNDLSLPIPPIEEQQRIVDLLDKVLPLCDSLQS